MNKVFVGLVIIADGVKEYQYFNLIKLFIVDFRVNLFVNFNYLKNC
jgi:hypothetical protein